MKKFVLIFVSAICLAGISLGIMASKYEPTLPKGAVVGVTPVGGLTREEAKKNLRGWWETARRSQATFTHPKFKNVPGPMSWTSAGMLLDDAASIDQVPLDDFIENTARTIGVQPQDGKYPVIYSFNEDRLKTFEDWIEKNKPKIRPANIQWDGKALVKRYEGTSIAFDAESYKNLLQKAFAEQTPIELPIAEGEKKIADSEIDKIKNVMSTFSTKFSAGNRPRSHNIKTASSYIDGLVLMPGDIFSFNDVVGQRTIAKGFQVAGVYVNGRHDEGVGGGICQVSTTLYNAVLRANLKIVQRSNHSLPVPYVPLGSDSTVSFPSLDLKFENDQPFPIAVDYVYAPGKLTVNILGVHNPNMKVEIERGSVSRKGKGVVYQHDPRLPYGKTVVVDKGGGSIRVATWRVVTESGKQIKRESLGVSYYPGAPMLVARNLKASKPAPRPKPATSGGSGGPVYGPVPGAPE